MLVPFFFHAYVNGPVPEATVVKETLVPRLFVTLASGVVTVVALTISTAEFEIALPQLPLTTAL
jgi:hypothetical protein